MSLAGLFGPHDAERFGERGVRLAQFPEYVRRLDAELGLDVAVELLRPRQRERDRVEDVLVGVGHVADALPDRLVVPLQGLSLQVVQQRTGPRLAFE